MAHSSNSSGSLLLTVINFFAGLVTVLALYWCYIPGKFWIIACGIWLWLLLFLLWLGKLVHVAWIRRLNPLSREQRHILVVPGFFLLWILAVSPLFDTIGFHLSKSALKHFVKQVPSTKPPWQVGIYSVKDYAVDEGGGSYIVTSQEQDMIDTVSSGFAFRPSPERSPFGQKGYILISLGDEWYIFQANNDY